MSLKGIKSLKPIKNYLSTFNTIITVFLNLSPFVVFLNVSKGKEKYTNIPPLMLLFNLINNAIWGCYWHRRGEFSGFFCSFICGTIATLFVVWYIYYFTKKKIRRFLIYCGFQFLIETIIIIFYVSEILALPVIGILLIIINTLQYIAPAQNLIKVIKEKNHKLIPIVSTILGALCSGGWLLFALIIGDINCLIPNLLGCISSIITTLIWFWIYTKYNNKGKENEEEKELAEKEEEKNKQK